MVAALLLGTARALPGQTPPNPAPGSGPVTGYSNLIVTVDNLETSVAFYRDLIGLEVLSMRPGSPDNKFVNLYAAKVSGSPAGVVFGSAILKLPGAGFNLLMTEFGNVDRTRREAGVGGTGATTLVLIVKDLDGPFQALKKAGARIVTRGGAPADLLDHSRSVMVRDADGFLVELVHPARLSGSGPLERGNILSAHVRLTVSRLDDTIRFYKDVLGFEFPSASAGGLPGMAPSFEFIEHKVGAKASPFERLRDPGTAAFSLSVRNVDALLAAMKASGAPVVSAGAEPAVSPNGGRNVFVRDPDGFFLELEGPSAR
jgi:catechol 2,3-dioxygenase-like lactoylglutathione lyase family enzyme